eukprot:4914805-Amphidinium_carterae.1
MGSSIHLVAFGVHSCVLWPHDCTQSMTKLHKSNSADYVLVHAAYTVHISKECVWVFRGFASGLIPQVPIRFTEGEDAASKAVQSLINLATQKLERVVWVAFSWLFETLSLQKEVQLVQRDAAALSDLVMRRLEDC